MSGLSVLVGVAPFVPFFVILLFLVMRRQPPCPDCGEPFPRIQSAFKNTKRQWIEGGYVCLKCGCEADTAGRKVAEGTPIRAGWFVIQIDLLTLASVLGALFLAFILHR